MKTEFYDLIYQSASTFKLDAPLLTAQITVESGMIPWAWNPEPGYHYLWDVRAGKPFRTLTQGEIMREMPPPDFHSLAGDPDQEWWGQQASWGLLQIMGAVAREHGFDGPYLTELCDPVVNLTVGCAHLSALFEWAKGDRVRALAAYNGGKGGNMVPPFRNQAYADRVLKVLALV